MRSHPHPGGRYPPAQPRTRPRGPRRRHEAGASTRHGEAAHFPPPPVPARTRTSPRPPTPGPGLRARAPLPRNATLGPGDPSKFHRVLRLHRPIQLPSTSSRPSSLRRSAISSQGRDGRTLTERTEEKEHAVLRSAVSRRFVAWALKRMHAIRAVRFGIARGSPSRHFRPDAAPHLRIYRSATEFFETGSEMRRPDAAHIRPPRPPYESGVTTTGESTHD